MGNRRKPSPPSRTRLAVLTTAAAGSALLGTVGGAHADPKPDLATVQAQVDKLYSDAEAATEKYNGTKVRQQQLQAQTGQLQDRVAAGQDRLNLLQTQLGAVAAAQYRSGGIDPTVRLMLDSDPATYLESASAQDRAAATQAEALAALRREQRKLDQDRSEAAAALQQIQDVGTRLAAQKADVQGRLAEAQALLNTLSAADRARIKAQEEAKTQADAAARASRSADRPAHSGSTDSGSTYNGPATGRAAAAVQFAYAQLGKPYEWGATGPSTFDCSGLTGAAWRAAGVSLPRVSQDQWNAGRHVAKADLQPGDLVFFYSDLHHVGLYIGNGQMIHAPRTGENVKILDIDYMPSYQGAVRP
ncbi:C40 family peptidase [Kitasatospora kazusensis]|uniref:C40 family peptidase n=1 Tax=Kitasatospora kazusensis TaxID=407974 RepID=A0ABN2YX44_9ACTN